MGQKLVAEGIGVFFKGYFGFFEGGVACSTYVMNRQCLTCSAQQSGCSAVHVVTQCCIPDPFGMHFRLSCYSDIRGKVKRQSTQLSDGESPVFE